MKLWEKGVTPEHKIIEFTSGNDRKTDMLLAPWDIAGSMAHAIMLSECGLISREEKKDLLNALFKLSEKEKAGSLKIEEGVEDIHSQVEKELTSVLGPGGKKIHTGRSRNDQVLVDIRLYTRSEIDRLAGLISRLFNILQELSEKNREVLIPGYTHMQPAMISSFGLWFGSWTEGLADDLLILSAARAMNNRNPLGTAAGYGSTLPVDRKITTELLEFDDLLYNSAYAALSRGKAELAVASALASVAQTLSRLSMEICLFMSAEFRFLDLPDELVTGSSIMPQKRNPDVFELIRGKSNLIQTIPGQVAALSSNLPSGYNRDLQLYKQLISCAFADIGECLDIMCLVLPEIKVRTDILDNQLYNSIYSTEEVNRMVRKGIPFRDAYKSVAENLKKGSFSKTSLPEYTHEGSVGNLSNNEIREIFESRIVSFKSKSPAELTAKLYSYK